MSYRSDGGGPAALASGHCAVAAPQPSLHMAVAPATRRDSGGAEARAPIRCRRAHSHQPGLCSDKWGASCPDGGAVAGGPRPPSERCRSWSYEVGPAADTASARSVLPYMRPPATTPQPSPTRPSRQRPRNHPPSFPRRRESTGRRGVPSPMCDRPRRPRVPPPTWLSRQRPGAPKGNTNALKSGRYSPRFNAVRTALSQRPGGPGLPRRTPSSAAPHQAHGRRGDAHGPAGGHAACPHREQPPPRLSAEDTPWANRPGKGLRPKSIKGGSSNSLGKGALAGKQLLFYPPASFKRRQKTQSNLTKGD